MAELTEQEFRRHLFTKFQIPAENRDPLELELVEVTGYQGDDSQESGMERFSVFFIGPPNVELPQYTYPLHHSELGVCDIFLVPVGLEEKGYRYEAVFNFYRKNNESSK